MKYSRGRRQRGYDGAKGTNWMARDLLPKVMKEIAHAVGERPDLVLAAWPEVIGPQLASMTEAISFLNGVLVVKVKNATLFSLLSQREKGRLLADLKARFPKTNFANIVFRMG